MLLLSSSTIQRLPHQQSSSTPMLLLSSSTIQRPYNDCHINKAHLPQRYYYHPVPSNDPTTTATSTKLIYPNITTIIQYHPTTATSTKLIYPNATTIIQYHPTTLQRLPHQQSSSTPTLQLSSSTIQRPYNDCHINKAHLPQRYYYYLVPSNDPTMTATSTKLIYPNVTTIIQYHPTTLQRLPHQQSSSTPTLLLSSSTIQRLPHQQSSSTPTLLLSSSTIQRLPHQQSSSTPTLLLSSSTIQRPYNDCHINKAHLPQHYYYHPVPSNDPTTTATSTKLIYPNATTIIQYHPTTLQRLPHQQSSSTPTLLLSSSTIQRPYNDCHINKAHLPQRYYYYLVPSNDPTMTATSTKLIYPNITTIIQYHPTTLQRLPHQQSSSTPTLLLSSSTIHRPYNDCHINKAHLPQRYYYYLVPSNDPTTTATSTKLIYPNVTTIIIQQSSSTPTLLLSSSTIQRPYNDCHINKAHLPQRYYYHPVPSNDPTMTATSTKLIYPQRYYYHPVPSNDCHINKAHLPQRYYYHPVPSNDPTMTATSTKLIYPNVTTIIQYHPTTATSTKLIYPNVTTIIQYHPTTLHRLPHQQSSSTPTLLLLSSTIQRPYTDCHINKAHLPQRYYYHPVPSNDPTPTATSTKLIYPNATTIIQYRPMTLQRLPHQQSSSTPTLLLSSSTVQQPYTDCHINKAHLPQRYYYHLVPSNDPTPTATSTNLIYPNATTIIQYRPTTLHRLPHQQSSSTPTLLLSSSTVQRLPHQQSSSTPTLLLSSSTVQRPYNDCHINKAHLPQRYYYHPVPSNDPKTTATSTKLIYPNVTTIIQYRPTTLQRLPHQQSSSTPTLLLSSSTIQRPYTDCHINKAHLPQSYYYHPVPSNDPTPTATSTKLIYPNATTII